MAKPFAIRRASIYRQRAQGLTETAREERRVDMLDQAATFQRAADAMAPVHGVGVVLRFWPELERSTRLRLRPPLQE